MVLIWTQFGVKQKNGNVKCKVRVMHRGDSSGSASSAVSTVFIKFPTCVKAVNHSLSQFVLHRHL